MQTFRRYQDRPRDMWVKKLRRTARDVQPSSGTDVVAQDVKFDPATGAFSVGTFSTNASTPLQAHNEAYDRLVACGPRSARIRSGPARRR